MAKVEEAIESGEVANTQHLKEALAQPEGQTVEGFDQLLGETSLQTQYLKIIADKAAEGVPGAAKELEKAEDIRLTVEAIKVQTAFRRDFFTLIKKSSLLIATAAAAGILAEKAYKARLPGEEAKIADEQLKSYFKFFAQREKTTASAVKELDDLSRETRERARAVREYKGVDIERQFTDAREKLAESLNLAADAFENQKSEIVALNDQIGRLQLAALAITTKLKIQMQLDAFVNNLKMEDEAVRLRDQFSAELSGFLKGFRLPGAIEPGRPAALATPQERVFARMPELYKGFFDLERKRQGILAQLDATSKQLIQTEYDLAVAKQNGAKNTDTLRLKEQALTSTKMALATQAENLTGTLERLKEALDQQVLIEQLRSSIENMLFDLKKTADLIYDTTSIDKALGTHPLADVAAQWEDVASGIFRQGMDKFELEIARIQKEKGGVPTQDRQRIEWQRKEELILRERAKEQEKLKREVGTAEGILSELYEYQNKWGLDVQNLMDEVRGGLERAGEVTRGRGGRAEFRGIPEIDRLSERLQELAERAKRDEYELMADVALAETNTWLSAITSNTEAMKNILAEVGKNLVSTKKQFVERVAEVRGAGEKITTGDAKAILRMHKNQPGFEYLSEAKQAGGTISGPGGVDKVPAMLTAGEYVIKKGSVDKLRQFYGDDVLDYMNQKGKLPERVGFQTGGGSDPRSMAQRAIAGDNAAQAAFRQNPMLMYQLPVALRKQVEKSLGITRGPGGRTVPGATRVSGPTRLAQGGWVGFQTGGGSDLHSMAQKAIDGDKAAQEYFKNNRMALYSLPATLRRQVEKAIGITRGTGPTRMQFGGLATPYSLKSTTFQMQHSKEEYERILADRADGSRKSTTASAMETSFRQSKGKFTQFDALTGPRGDTRTKSLAERLAPATAKKTPRVPDVRQLEIFMDLLETEGPERALRMLSGITGIPTGPKGPRTMTQTSTTTQDIGNVARALNLVGGGNYQLFEKFYNELTDKETEEFSKRAKFELFGPRDKFTPGFELFGPRDTFTPGRDTSEFELFRPRDKFTRGHQQPEQQGRDTVSAIESAIKAAKGVGRPSGIESATKAGTELMQSLTREPGLGGAGRLTRRATDHELRTAVEGVKRKDFTAWNTLSMEDKQRAMALPASGMRSITPKGMGGYIKKFAEGGKVDTSASDWLRRKLLGEKAAQRIEGAGADQPPPDPRTPLIKYLQDLVVTEGFDPTSFLTDPQVAAVIKEFGLNKQKVQDHIDQSLTLGLTADDIVSMDDAVWEKLFQLGGMVGFQSGGAAKKQISGLASLGMGMGGKARKIPAYGRGSKFIPSNQLAYLHGGEAVIPASMNLGGMAKYQGGGAVERMAIDEEAITNAIKAGIEAATVKAELQDNVVRLEDNRVELDPAAFTGLKESINTAVGTGISNVDGRVANLEGQARGWTEATKNHEEQISKLKFEDLPAMRIETKSEIHDKTEVLRTELKNSVAETGAELSIYDSRMTAQEREILIAKSDINATKGDLSNIGSKADQAISELRRRS